jgi:hypothetical protein
MEVMLQGCGVYAFAAELASQMPISNSLQQAPWVKLRLAWGMKVSFGDRKAGKGWGRYVPRP